MALKHLNGIDAASQKIVHVADGSASDDAATWGQVQNLLAGLSWKLDCRAASTANVTISSPGASIDGVTLSTNDRVLLKNQTTASENGVYVFNGSSSAMTRATDMDASAEFNNATVSVLDGTVNAQTSWTCATKNPTVGSTSITFGAFAAGTSYSAGNGISIASNTITAVAVSGGGVSVVSGGIQVDRTKTPQLYAANVGNGSSTSIAVTHNLGTKDVVVQLRDASTDAFVLTDWVATDTNTVTLTFATAPASNAYRVTIHG